MPVTEVPVSEGWGVLHLFFHLQRGVLEDSTSAAKDFVARLQAFDARDDYQVHTFSVLGQKADFGLLVLGPDLAVLDEVTVEIGASPLGVALVPAASYVSLTETSEYTTTAADEGGAAGRGGGRGGRARGGPRRVPRAHGDLP